MSVNALAMRDVSNTLRSRVSAKSALEFKPGLATVGFSVSDVIAQAVQHQQMTISEVARQSVVDPVRAAVDADDYPKLLELASAKRKQLEVGLADLLYERGLALLRRCESGNPARWLLGGGLSQAETEARVDWGRMLEDNGLYERALAVYSVCTATDALLERRLDLLMRLGHLQEACRVAAAARAPGMPQSAGQAQRLVSVGLLSEPFPVPRALEAVLHFAAGQPSRALRAQEGKKDLMLQRAEHMRRAACMLRQLSPAVQEELAAALSCPVLRRNLAETAAEAGSGDLSRAVDEAAEAAAGRERADWRVLLCLVAARPERRATLLVQAAEQCHTAQRWKVWLDASLGPENRAVQRALMLRALSVAPEKHRPTLLIEAARREPEPETALKILQKCVRESGHWKAGLELAALQLREGHRGEALEALKSALAANPQIGRLWATLARWVEDEPAQRDAVLAAALALVPRSGELWVERGRSLACEAAWGEQLERCWSNALVFTPQYGDLFVEMLRAGLWRRLASRFGRAARRGQAGGAQLQEELRAWNTEPVEQLCVLASPNHGLLWDRLLAQLGGESGCVPIQILASAKLQMAKALLEAGSDKLLHDILFRD